MTGAAQLGRCEGAGPSGDPACDQVLEEAAEKNAPDHVRALFEMALLIGGGTVWYWIDRERQVADWEDFDSWKDRLTTDVMRFDNNPFRVNFAWHAISGAGFHLLARENNLSMWQAGLYNLGTSIVWEYALEYRENVSVNDLIFTSGAGLALGEFGHWLGVSLDDPDVSPWLRYTLGIPRSVHGLLDGRPAGDSGLAQVPRQHIHRRLSLGVSSGLAEIDRSDPRGEHGSAPLLTSVFFRGELAALPGHLEDGRASRFFREGNVSTLDVQITHSEEGDGMDVLADTIMLGWNRRNIAAGQGLETVLGLSMAYRYHRQRYGVWKDRIGVLHLPGPALDVHGFIGQTRVSAKLRGYADFAGIGAMTIHDWHAAHPDEWGKAILRKEGYYYGWGLSTRLALELESPWLRAGGELYAGRYASQEGLDRTQEMVTDESPSTDVVRALEVWLRTPPLEFGAFVEARGSLRHRNGELGELSATQSLASGVVSLGVEL